MTCREVLLKAFGGPEQPAIEDVVELPARVGRCAGKVVFQCNSQ
jgi:hypothetical protein